MVGTCPECGAQVVSRYPFEIGICHCRGNPIQVPLQLAIIPAPKIQKAIQKVSDVSGVAVEDLTDTLLKEASKAVMRGLRVHNNDKRT